MMLKNLYHSSPGFLMSQVLIKKKNKKIKTRGNYFYDDEKYYYELM